MFCNNTRTKFFMPRSSDDDLDFALGEPQADTHGNQLEIHGM